MCCCPRNVANRKAGYSKAVLKGQVNVSQAEFERIALGHVKELWTNYGQLGESESLSPRLLCSNRSSAHGKASLQPEPAGHVFAHKSDT